jgi:hypothetical protein
MKLPLRFIETYKFAYLYQNAKGTIEVQDSRGRLYSVEPNLETAKEQINQDPYFITWIVSGQNEALEFGQSDLG